MALRETAACGGAISREDETDLITLATKGDEGAFAELYDRHHDRVLRFIYHRVGRVEDAEDLTQKVFLQAWRALPRYRQTEVPFSGWLLAIAHNVAVSFLRTRKPTEPPLEDWSALRGPSDLDGAAERFDSQARIREAIRQLSPDQQAVVTLRFLEDLEYAEVAAIMGKAEGAVRVIQCRALQRLRRLVGERDADVAA